MRSKSALLSLFFVVVAVASVGLITPPDVKADPPMGTLWVVQKVECQQADNSWVEATAAGGGGFTAPTGCAWRKSKVTCTFWEPILDRTLTPFSASFTGTVLGSGAVNGNATEDATNIDVQFNPNALTASGTVVYSFNGQPVPFDGPRGQIYNLKFKMNQRGVPTTIATLTPSVMFVD